MLCVLLFIIGAYGYRLRGSAGNGGAVEDVFGMPSGATFGRLLFWAIPVSLVIFYKTHDDGLSILSMLAAYFGVLVGYLGGEFDLTQKRNRTLTNYLILTAKGISITTPLYWLFVVIPGAHMEIYPLIAGACFVPFSFMGVWLDKRFELPYVTEPSQWQEAMLGGAILATIGMSL